MREGKYNDPKHLIKINAKIACIMPVYVGKDKLIDYVLRGRISYDKYKNYQENKLESIKFTIACYKHYLAGVDYDLIIVNNGSKNQETTEYLDQLKNDVTILNRENIGFSFGAYKFAWEKFRNKYDYYLFHEQDIVPCKDNWLSEIVMAFMSDRNIGAVGNKLESRGRGHPASDVIIDSTENTRNRGFMYNFDGAFTFTSSSILSKVSKIGGLPVIPCVAEDRESAVLNELMFQQPIMELGYNIHTLENSDTFSTLGIQLIEFDEENIVPQKLSPMLHGHIRNTIKWFKDYFDWFNVDNGIEKV